MRVSVYILSLFSSLMLFSCSASKKVSKEGASKENVSVSKGEAKKIVSYARSFIGVPYKYGGNSPKEGFDCSGYVMYVYNKFNINVPRITRDYANFGKRVTINQIRLGDLILFCEYSRKNSNTIGHIGIVSQIEKERIFFLHAASGKKSGAVMESELIGIHLSKMMFITRVLN
jgi:hypothetical protein